MQNNLSEYYILTTDIDCSGFSGFTRIGEFTGTLDGDGHTISNLTINQSGFVNQQGLFSVATGATIKDLIITNATVSGNFIVGILAGSASNTTIKNVQVSGSMSSSASLSLMGALVGSMGGGGSISNSYTNVNITSGYSYVGGLVGTLGSTTISKSYAVGNINISRDSSSSVSAVGGLVGESNGTVSDSYAIGNVTGTGSQVGGAVGVMRNTAAVKRIYAKGSVSGGSSVGGLVGTIDSGGTVTNSYWDTQTTGQSSSAGGTGKTTAEMKTQSTFSNWNFTNVWQISSGQYPSLITIPVILSLSPSNGSTGAVTDAKLVMAFNKDVDAETGNIVVYRSGDGSVFQTIGITSGQIAGSGTDTITIDLNPDLDKNSEYYVKVDATAFDDPYSNSYAGISDANTWKFMTGSSLSTSSAAASPPACNDLIPHAFPDLFQIDTTKTSATLHFTPLTQNVTDHMITYGFTPGDERFAVLTKQDVATGALSFTVNMLSPNTTYYFRVRYLNGCSSGAWSNEVKIKTTGASFYRLK